MKQLLSRRTFLSATAAGIGGMACARFFPVFGEEKSGAWDFIKVQPA